MRIDGQKKALFFIFLFTIVWISVNIAVCLPEGKRKPPVGAGFSGEPHESGKPPKFSYQQRVPACLRQGAILNSKKALFSKGECSMNNNHSSIISKHLPFLRTYKALFWSFFVFFCAFCAFLWLKIHLITAIL